MRDRVFAIVDGNEAVASAAYRLNVATMKIGDQAALNEKEDQLLQAVLALFKAEPVMQVCQQYNAENWTDLKWVPFEIRF